MNRPTVYIESTIVSYLTSRPSRHIVAAAWQQVTRDWWELRRSLFDLFTSELVLTEAAQGDPEAAKRRLEALADIAILPISASVEQLAGRLVAENAVPDGAYADAIHIAVAAVHEVDYLMTWNCTHIDNAETKPVIRSVCAVVGLQCPEICTPQELMGEEYGRDPDRGPENS